MPIDKPDLGDLNRIRTDVEHYYTEKPREVVREAIAKAFPAVADLFRLAKEIPSEALGDAWQTMLDVHAVYERELEACRQTFESIEWPLASLTETRFSCPQCGSDLVAQDDLHNENHEAADCHCRACGDRIPSDRALELAIEAHFETETYIAGTDGGDQPVQTCPDCGLSTYLLTDEHVGCVSCGLVLTECGRCMADLTPENIDPHNSKLCSYCGYLMSKDD